MKTKAPEHAVRVNPIVARDIPVAVRERALARPSVVEDLSDHFRAQGWNLSVNFGSFTNPTAWDGILIGPAVTARYAPKSVPSPENHLGHQAIAQACPPGSIVLMDARQVRGAVLGGRAAMTLKAGGAAACVVDGMGRDFSEVNESGLVVRTRESGIEGGRASAQLVEIGSVVVINGVSIQSGDTLLMNRWGLVAIPGWISWDDVLEWMDTTP